MTNFLFKNKFKFLTVVLVVVVLVAIEFLLSSYFKLGTFDKIFQKRNINSHYLSDLNKEIKPLDILAYGLTRDEEKQLQEKTQKLEELLKAIDDFEKELQEEVVRMGISNQQEKLVADTYPIFYLENFQQGQGSILDCEDELDSFILFNKNQNSFTHWHKEQDDLVLYRHGKYLDYEKVNQKNSCDEVIEFIREEENVQSTRNRKSSEAGVYGFSLNSNWFNLFKTIQEYDQLFQEIDSKKDQIRVINTHSYPVKLPLFYSKEDLKNLVVENADKFGGLTEFDTSMPDYKSDLENSIPVICRESKDEIVFVLVRSVWGYFFLDNFTIQRENQKWLLKHNKREISTNFTYFIYQNPKIQELYEKSEQQQNEQEIINQIEDLIELSIINADCDFFYFEDKVEYTEDYQEIDSVHEVEYFVDKSNSFKLLNTVNYSYNNFIPDYKFIMYKYSLENLVPQLKNIKEQELIIFYDQIFSPNTYSNLTFILEDIIDYMNNWLGEVALDSDNIPYFNPLSPGEIKQNHQRLQQEQAEKEKLQNTPIEELRRDFVFPSGVQLTEEQIEAMPPDILEIYDYIITQNFEKIPGDPELREKWNDYVTDVLGLE